MYSATRSIAEFLIINGIDVYSTNINNETAQCLAYDYKNEDVEKSILIYKILDK